jgi:2,5-diketo-D-gluconate reductase A
MLSTVQAKLGDGSPIPWVGFGTYLCSDEQVSSSCTYALNNGYKHIDSAEGYRTEVAVGKVLSELEVKPFVTTKLWPGMGDNAKNYDAVIQSALDSRQKLGVPIIDLYLIHAPFAGPSGPSGRIEQWRALVELQSRGVCRSIGVSNYSVAHLTEIEAAGLPKPAANQLEIHPLCQHKDIVAYCRERGILVIAYSSLAPLSDWRPGQTSAKTDSTDSTESPLFTSLAAKYGVTTSQLLLRWALQSGFPILPKSNRPARIDLNMDLFGFNIDVDDMSSIDALDENKTFAWPSGDPCLTP